MIWDRGRMDEWDVSVVTPEELARVTDNETGPLQRRLRRGRYADEYDRRDRRAQAAIGGSGTADPGWQVGVREAEVRVDPKGDRGASGGLADAFWGHGGGDGIDGAILASGMV